MVLFTGGRERKSKAVPLALLKSMQNTTRKKTIIAINQNSDVRESHRSGDGEQQSPMSRRG
jgi:hypothetical protein